MDSYYVYASPIGQLNIVEKKGYITNIALRDSVDVSQLTFSKTEVIAKCITQLEEYFRGQRKSFAIPLDPEGTEFQWLVWQELLKVPYGQCSSYHLVAEAIGSPKGARAVGRSVGANPVLILIPCHRILGSDGSLTGFSAGLKRKSFLLDLEGVIYR
ncbi:MAG: methylated-DNA--[protein]-cysteine S-methyltransferase [Fusobacteria bacterium]|nr:methylated-DNA--[protein]-cysteine S-methyltransferase [Fusobacteriota bacterium]